MEDPPPGWLTPPPCDGWLGCSPFALTKRTCSFFFCVVFVLLIAFASLSRGLRFPTRKSFLLRGIFRRSSFVAHWFKKVFVTWKRLHQTSLCTYTGWALQDCRREYSRWPPSDLCHPCHDSSSTTVYVCLCDACLRHRLINTRIVTSCTQQGSVDFVLPLQMFAPPITLSWTVFFWNNLQTLFSCTQQCPLYLLAQSLHNCVSCVCRWERKKQHKAEYLLARKTWWWEQIIFHLKRHTFW